MKSSQNWTKYISFVMILMTTSLGLAQTWTHDFETAGGYTASIAECSDGTFDYFLRTDGTNIGDAATSPQGTYYFAAQDVDAGTCPAAPTSTVTIDFDDIDISGCSGMTLQMLAASPSNFDGWDNPDYVHILYDIDNSGTWSNLLWFEGAGGTNVDTREDTNFDGTGDGTLLGATFQNFTGTITGTGALIDIRVEFNLGSGGEDFCIDNLRLFGTGCGVAAPTITTGAISTAPFDVECETSTTASGTVDFTSTGTFTAGNVYTAQLSDANGLFTNPVNIGTLASTANSGTINITIPATSEQGTGYIIRVISDSPGTIGSSSTSFTINQNDVCSVPLPAAGLVINEWSNGPVGNEEYYEFVVTGECGESVDIRGFILDDNNATFTNPADYDANASGIAPGHFRFTNDAQWGSIPVGSVIVVYNANEKNGSVPTDDPTDSDNDSLYVVPHDHTTLFERCTTYPAASDPDSIYAPCTYAAAPTTGWNPLSLRNSGDAIQVRQPDGTYYHGVSYGGSEITGGPDNLKLFNGDGTGDCGWFNDGDPFSVSDWSSGTVGGNETPGDPNNAANEAWLLLMRDTASATCPVIVLPVEIGAFKGMNAPEGNLLYWYTLSERDADYFLVEKSTDGKNWTEVGQINAVGNSSETQEYQLIDVKFGSFIHYYRLIQFDNDGTRTKYSRLVTIDNTERENNDLVGIYNLLGQKVDAWYKGVQIRLYSDGTTQRVYKN